MAGTQVERESFPNLSLGISDTSIVGDLAAAEAFLSGEAETVTGDVDDLEDIKEEEEEEVKKPTPKKKEKVEKQIDPFEEIDKDEEDEDEEDDDKEEEDEEKDEEVKKPKKKGEEEEKETEDEEETEDEDQEEGDGVKPNQYEGIHKDLLTNGVFTQQEKEEEAKTPEQLLERFQLEGQIRGIQWLDNFLSREGEDRKEMFEAIFVNGVDPKDYLPVYNQSQSFKEMDITVEDNQKTVFREFYKRVGLKPETIEKNLQKVIDYGDLEDTVTDLHEQIIEQDDQRLADIREEAEQRAESKKAAETAYRTGLQKLLGEKLKEKEFFGIPLTEKKAREALDFLYTPKYQTPNGQKLSEFDKFILESRKPENLHQRVLIALLKMDNFDFSKIEKKGVSKESSGIFASLAQQVTKSKTRPAKTTSASKNNDPWKNNL